MNPRFIWIGTPVIFSLLGILAAYVNNGQHTLLLCSGGFFAGLLLAMFTLAGEESA